MENFSSFFVFCVVVGIIIYCIIRKKKKERQQEEYYKRKVLEQEEKRKEEERIAEEVRKEEERIAEEKRKEKLKQREERVQKYKISLNKFPPIIKKKIDGCVNYARSTFTPMNLLLIGCASNYIPKILEVMAFDVGVNYRLVENKNPKGGDLAAILTGLDDGDFVCFTNIGALSLEARSMLMKAMTTNGLDFIIGKGVSEKQFLLPLAKFSTVIVVDDISRLPEGMMEMFYEVIDFKKYNYDFRLMFIDDFAEKYSLIFSIDVKERLAKQFSQYNDLQTQLLEIRNKACDLNISEITESFFEKNVNPIPEIEKIDEMNGREFELFTGDLLSKNGFENVTVTQSSCDFGVDVIAEKEGVKYAIQCKRYNNSIGISAVQEVIASKSLNDCHIACVLTNNFFTPAAVELAKRNLVMLWDRNKLEELIENAKERR